MGLTNATLLPRHVLIQSVLMNANVYQVSNKKTHKNVKVIGLIIFLIYSCLMFKIKNTQTDIDECVLGNNCDEATSTCKNIVGSYVCDCKAGFIRFSNHKCQGTCQLFQII